MIQCALGYWNVGESLLHVAPWYERVWRFSKHTWILEKKETVEMMRLWIACLNEEKVDEKRTLTNGQVWIHLHQIHQVLLNGMSGFHEDNFSLDSYLNDTMAMESFRHHQ